MKRVNNKQIERTLKTRLGLEVRAQTITDKVSGRTLYSVENIPIETRATITGLTRLCRRICKELGASLYGTVNIDIVSMGDKPTFDMMAEVE